MSVTIKEPHDLRALLATMKSAKEKGVNMNIWDRDVKAVEDAISIIEGVRQAPQPSVVIIHKGKATPAISEDFP